MVKDPEKAKEQLEKLRKEIRRISRKFYGLSEDEVISELRKMRERLWDETFAHRP